MNISVFSTFQTLAGDNLLTVVVPFHSRVYLDGEELNVHFREVMSTSPDSWETAVIPVSQGMVIK